jgi:hypothetical protein
MATKRTKANRGKKLTSGKTIKEVKPLAKGAHYQAVTISLSRPTGKSPM